MRQAIIVIIDPNPESREKYRQLLADTGYIVRDERWLLDELQMPDLVLVATPIDEKQSALLRDFAQRPQRAPIGFLLTEYAANQAAEAFDLGADDIMQRPATTQELLARIQWLLVRHERQVIGTPGHAFSGRLQDYTVLELLERFQQGQGTATITLEGHLKQGRLWLESGTLLAAEEGIHVGEEALVRLMFWSDGQFTITPALLPELPAQRLPIDPSLSRAHALLQRTQALLERLPPLHQRFDPQFQRLQEALKLEQSNPMTEQLLLQLVSYPTLEELLYHLDNPWFDSLAKLAQFYEQGFFTSTSSHASRQIAFFGPESSLSIPETTAEPISAQEITAGLSVAAEEAAWYLRSAAQPKAPLGHQPHLASRKDRSTKVSKSPRRVTPHNREIHFPPATTHKRVSKGTLFPDLSAHMPQHPLTPVATDSLDNILLQLQDPNAAIDFEALETVPGPLMDISTESLSFTLAPTAQPKLQLHHNDASALEERTTRQPFNRPHKVGPATQVRARQSQEQEMGSGPDLSLSANDSMVLTFPEGTHLPPAKPRPLPGQQQHILASATPSDMDLSGMLDEQANAMLEQFLESGFNETRHQPTHVVVEELVEPSAVSALFDDLDLFQEMKEITDELFADALIEAASDDFEIKLNELQGEEEDALSHTPAKLRRLDNHLTLGLEGPLSTQQTTPETPTLNRLSQQDQPLFDEALGLSLAAPHAKQRFVPSREQLHIEHSRPHEELRLPLEQKHDPSLPTDQGDPLPSDELQALTQALTDHLDDAPQTPLEATDAEIFGSYNVPTQQDIPQAALSDSDFQEQQFNARIFPKQFDDLKQDSERFTAPQRQPAAPPIATPPKSYESVPHIEGVLYPSSDVYHSASHTALSSSIEHASEVHLPQYSYQSQHALEQYSQSIQSQVSHAHASQAHSISDSDIIAQRPLGRSHKSIQELQQYLLPVEETQHLLEDLHQPLLSRDDIQRSDFHDQEDQALFESAPIDFNEASVWTPLMDLPASEAEGPHIPQATYTRRTTSSAPAPKFAHMEPQQEPELPTASSWQELNEFGDYLDQFFDEQNHAKDDLFGHLERVSRSSEAMLVPEASSYSLSSQSSSLFPDSTSTVQGQSQRSNGQLESIPTQHLSSAQVSAASLSLAPQASFDIHTSDETAQASPAPYKSVSISDDDAPALPPLDFPDTMPAAGVFSTPSLNQAATEASVPIHAEIVDYQRSLSPTASHASPPLVQNHSSTVHDHQVPAQSIEVPLSSAHVEVHAGAHANVYIGREQAQPMLSVSSTQYPASPHSGQELFQASGSSYYIVEPRDSQIGYSTQASAAIAPQEQLLALQSHIPPAPPEGPKKHHQWDTHDEIVKREKGSSSRGLFAVTLCLLLAGWVVLLWYAQIPKPLWQAILPPVQRAQEPPPERRAHRPRPVVKRKAAPSNIPKAVVARRVKPEAKKRNAPPIQRRNLKHIAKKGTLPRRKRRRRYARKHRYLKKRRSYRSKRRRLVERKKPVLRRVTIIKLRPRPLPRPRLVVPPRRVAVAPKPNTSSFSALLAKARKHVEEREKLQASKVLKQALALKPRSFQALLMMGRVMRSRGRNRAALRYLKKAYRINRRMGKGLMILGELYYERNELAPARRYLNDYISYYPNGTEAPFARQLLSQIGGK